MSTNNGRISYQLIVYVLLFNAQTHTHTHAHTHTHTHAIYSCKSCILHVQYLFHASLATYFVYFADVPSGLQSSSYQSNDLKGMRVHNED